jgi:hypothetical protein
MDLRPGSNGVISIEASAADTCFANFKQNDAKGHISKIAFRSAGDESMVVSACITYRNVP